MSQIIISALYKFVRLPHYQGIKSPLLHLLNNQGIRGTILLAQEGINGTVSGRPDAIAAMYAWLQKQPGLDNIVHKESYHHVMPFNRTKVKLKKEIVTLGVEGLDPLKLAGTYVKPQDWNQLISAEDVLVLDTRNDYEVQIGTFKHAVNPQTSTFREFPTYVQQHLDKQKHTKVAMFCTGGIRCEKSTAYLKQLGFAEVYHLQGGILQYLEDVPASESLWQGECFVFDERVGVGPDLQETPSILCFNCQMPLSLADQQHPAYVVEKSCPYCIHGKSEGRPIVPQLDTRG